MTMPLLDFLKGRRRTEPSGEIARERLRLVLAHDRNSFPPGLLETLKDEIVTVISRHVPINAAAVEVTLSQGPWESRLVADIPLASPGARARTKR